MLRNQLSPGDESNAQSFTAVFLTFIYSTSYISKCYFSLPVFVFLFILSCHELMLSLSSHFCGNVNNDKIPIPVSLIEEAVVSEKAPVFNHLVWPLACIRYPEESLSVIPNQS